MYTKSSITNQDDQYNIVKEHICQLDEPEDPIVLFLDSGYFVAFRRYFRRLLTVSVDSPACRNVLKSSDAIRQERRRHLRYHYYMIHPFSIFRWYWEGVMMCVFSLLFLIIPIEISTIKPLWWLKSLKFSLDIICLFDVALTFFSGFYVYRTKQIVLNFKLVAYIGYVYCVWKQNKQHTMAFPMGPAVVSSSLQNTRIILKLYKHFYSQYMKTYFLIDLISSLPIDFILCLQGFDGDYWWFKTFGYLKIFRTRTFLTYFRVFQIEFVVLSSLMMIKMLKVFLLLILTIVWMSSITYVVHRVTRPLLPVEVMDHPYGFLLIWYETVSNVLLIGASTHGKNTAEIAYTIMTLVCGFVLEVLIYGNITQILYENTNRSNKYKRIKQQLQEYSHYQELPEALRRRIAVYYEFRFQKVYYNEADLLSLLSDNLREEINIYHCKRLVACVDFFKAFPPSILSHIVKCLKFEIFLTNDVIVRAGTVGDCMYFIRQGCVAIYTSNGKEVCHISDGSHFGEIALIMEKELRVASVVAAECCELYNLKRVDFENTIDPYPELKYRMRKIAKERLQNTIKLMETANV